MASRFKTVTIEEVTKLNEAAENLRIRKVFLGRNSENYEL